MQGDGMADAPILIVEDEAHTRTALSTALAVLGLPGSVGCADLADARQQLGREDFALVLLDLQLPDGSGETLLTEITAQHPGLPVIVVTGTNEVATAVRCMRAHAVDYLVKPVRPAELEVAVRAALAGRALASENRQLAGLMRSDGLRHPEAFAAILSVDQTMLRLLQYVEVIAPSQQVTLISGEIGTGKSMLARTIHQLSGRRGELVEIDVAGLGDDAFADTLFGHRRGAFPGATGERLGLVQRAAGGTLLLEEITRLGEAAQARLLRLLADGEYYPLGADQPRRSSARVIVTSTHGADTAMQGDRLRPDLFHCLQAHHIALPPLRQRSGDIPILLHHAVALAAAGLGLARPEVTSGHIHSAQANPWPGNIGGLLAAARDAVARSVGGSMAADAFGPQAQDGGIGFPFPAILPTLEAMRDQLVTEALRRTGGDLVEASRQLGMSRWGLSKRLRQGRQHAPTDA
jgi:DNA-binding NtrC family response regulator